MSSNNRRFSFKMNDAAVDGPLRRKETVRQLRGDKKEAKHYQRRMPTTNALVVGNCALPAAAAGGQPAANAPAASAVALPPAQAHQDGSEEEGPPEPVQTP
mmetsp:Transcript_46147/g.111862  ORF Transcript_46147/g.111862 Transcript_46147/m.111862 type:complete len:101 (+) Transcript_46147:226-528(+)